jgi:hypothetical protein
MSIQIRGLKPDPNNDPIAIETRKFQALYPDLDSNDANNAALLCQFLKDRNLPFNADNLCIAYANLRTQLKHNVPPPAPPTKNPPNIGMDSGCPTGRYSHNQRARDEAVKEAEQKAEQAKRESARKDQEAKIKAAEVDEANSVIARRARIAPRLS